MFQICCKNRDSRKGRSGAWVNITESSKEDGKRLVFISNTISNKNNQERQNNSELPSPSSTNDSATFAIQHTQSDRKITKAYLEKQERGIQLVFSFSKMQKI